MSVSKNLEQVKLTIPEKVTLIAVSKTKPNSAIEEAYALGQRDFGENRIQELKDKAAVLPEDIRWHAIGHLQTNKVKYIVPFVWMIHAVDSLKLLVEINKQAIKHNRVINCLLQFHIAQESSKFGLSMVETEELIATEAFNELKNIKIAGVMGMATFTDNQDVIRNEFKTLKNYFDLLKPKIGNDSFKEISMGMSGDYQIAIEEGSTIVRVGSSIFGTRN